jgi:hypothetical protein
MDKMGISTSWWLSCWEIHCKTTFKFAIRN